MIGPSKCTKRETEIQIAATKKKTQILSGEQQTVKVTAAESTRKADSNTELQLQWCRQRRGIALDQCRLVEWDNHQRGVQYMWQHAAQTPEKRKRVHLQFHNKSFTVVLLTKCLCSNRQKTGRKAQEANEASFDLGEAKRKLTFFAKQRRFTAKQRDGWARK